MITIDNKEYRNIQEQVEKNKKDIEYILTEEGTLNEFGLKVIGQVADAVDMPSVEDYKMDHDDWQYGDCYIVGTQAPYIMYILTRANGTHPNDYWLNIGQFPLVGPQGEVGPRGEQGPEGPQGIQGPQGDAGLNGKDGHNIFYLDVDLPTDSQYVAYPIRYLTNPFGLDVKIGDSVISKNGILVNIEQLLPGAQQTFYGKASVLKPDVSNKVDKLEPTPGPIRAYTSTPDGDSSKDISINKDPGTLVLRTATGAIRAADPVNELEVVTKGYADAHYKGGGGIPAVSNGETDDWRPGHQGEKITLTSTLANDTSNQNLREYTGVGENGKLVFKDTIDPNGWTQFRTYDEDGNVEADMSYQYTSSGFNIVDNTKSGTDSSLLRVNQNDITYKGKSLLNGGGDNVVTLDTDQTISGEKNFDKRIMINSGAEYGTSTPHMSFLQSNELMIAENNGNWNHVAEYGIDNIKRWIPGDIFTLSLPNRGGTLALTSDIPVIATTAQPGLVAAGNWLTVNQSTGKMECGVLTKAQFNSADDKIFISKGTLNNLQLGGGGSTLYYHNMELSTGGTMFRFGITTKSSTSFTLTSFKQWLYEHEYTSQQYMFLSGNIGVFLENMNTIRVMQGTQQYTASYLYDPHVKEVD